MADDILSPALDAGRVEAFAREMVDALNHAALTLMLSIGHRAGLFDGMAALPPSDPGAIARATGLSERYVREWLGAMVAGGVVEFDAGANTYRLPAEHAACLTRGARPTNFAASAQWFPLLGAIEDRLLEAFGDGRGVPYSAYRRFHEVMAEESEQTVVPALLDAIIPLVPGLGGRLGRGIDVLDVGCGRGRAMLRLAAAFPASRFAGYDISEEAIADAAGEARRRGLTNVRFEVRDVAHLGESAAYDLVTAFDAIHDQPRPAEVLRGIHAALRPGGTFLMQEISGSGSVAEDREHPVGTLLYTISCAHCMSVSLAAGGPGLGAMWGRPTALRMLDEAGFGRVRMESLPHDVMNDYYVVERP